MSNAGQGPSPKREMLNREFTWWASPCEPEFLLCGLTLYKIIKIRN